MYILVVVINFYSISIYNSHDVLVNCCCLAYRLGLGAECDEVKRKEKEEKSLISKRMQRKIVPRGLTDSPPTKKQRTHRDQQESESEDEEDSRTNIAMSAKSRRRKLEMLKKLKLDKKHFKKKKKKTNLASRDEGTKCRGNPLNYTLIKSEAGIGTDNQLLSIETGIQDTVPPLNTRLPTAHKGKDEVSVGTNK